jgi:predicted ATPase
MITLKRIALSGYKSIREMELELRPVNVLIGENGAGKSNLVSFLRLIRQMMAKRLSTFIAESGRASSLLFYGPRRTPRIRARLDFESKSDIVAYEFELAHAPSDTLFFDPEDVLVLGPERIEHGVVKVIHSSGAVVGGRERIGFNRGGRESLLPDAPAEVSAIGREIWSVLSECHVFHFQDVSSKSRLRQSVDIHNNRCLQHDGGNLAALLYRLRQTEPTAYRRIVETIRQIAPWFDDFAIKPLALDPTKVHLEWRERGSDEPFYPHQLPDGALRAMAMVTLLLQPEKDLPRLLVIDEPELGLHPYAINVLAGLVEGASHHCQVILATQSVPLLEQFDPEDVVVVEREEGASTFKRLRSEDLQDWLEDYSLGELWQKNVFGGGPA